MVGWSVTSLYQVPRHCTPKAREAVLGIINSAPAPLRTRDIYNLLRPSAKSSPPADTPSRTGKDESVRSMTYLKTVVLRELAGRNYIEKVRMKGTTNAWVWRPKAAPPVIRTKSTISPTPSLPGFQELPPAAVGVGEDWSHLNKRRQRAREGKVERDLQRMRVVQKFQRRAARQALNPTEAKSIPSSVASQSN